MILTLNKLREYREITDNVICDSIEIYIKEAEEIDLKNWLGIGLYYDMIANSSVSKYKDLIHGVKYTKKIQGVDVTIDYKGLMPLIAYWAYARILKNYGVIVGKTGIVEGEYEESSNMSVKKKDYLIQDNKGLADSYKNEVNMFLCDHKTSYPLYCGTGGHVSNVKFYAL